MRDPSPAPSASTLSSVATSIQEEQPESSSAPPQKKRKLTFAEKEVQRIEQEYKKKEREEQKARRDEEKRVKDEERRKKREEKEAKDREKELDKQRKEEEKLKKERVSNPSRFVDHPADELPQAQTKLSFFTKPKVPLPQSPSAPGAAAMDTTRRKSLSAEPHQGPHLTDYERKFLPFQPPSHTSCALPFSSASRDAETSKRALDSFLEQIRGDNASTQGPPSASSFFPSSQAMPRGLWQPNACEVMESMHGTSQKPIDLDDTCRPEDLLDLITIRHLHFAEDVRPPYVGSYTKAYSPKSSRTLRRNPFKKVRKDTNYDYDSEAEWEEPEEGEDLLSDADDDDESVGAADEMEDFLDEDDGPKRGLITGNLKPISTGICWEGATSESSVDLDTMRVEFFLDLPTQSVNPFSSAYWQQDARGGPIPAILPPPDVKPVLKLGNGVFSSPRQSANSNGTIGAAEGMTGPIMASGPGKTKSTVPPLSGKDLSEFGEAVVGSNIPKTDLVKALKKR